MQGRSGSTYRLALRLGASTGLCLLATSLFPASPGLAQGAAPDDGAAEPAVIEEIVVTARRRAENLQETPISISAFTAEGLEARQIQQIDGIAQLTPNLVFESSSPIAGSSSSATMFIRGVGQANSVPTVDLGVGLYVDGVYLARSVGGLVDLLDVERIEVLRGPQGTLFGRNTIGGAISITTAKPDGVPAGEASLLYGTDDRVIARGSVNVPLADNLFAKISGGYEVQDGYVKRPAGEDTGDKDRLAGRLALRWEPTYNVTVDLAFDGTRERTNGAAFVLSDVVPSAAFPSFSNLVLNAPTCAIGPDPLNSPPALPACFGPHWISSGLDEDYSDEAAYSNLDLWGVSSVVTVDLGAVELKSITAYRDLESAFILDQDHTPVDIARVITDYTQWQFSQELQLVGASFDDRLDWVVGAYYFTEQADDRQRVTFPVADFISGGDNNNESLAGFAQATLALTDVLDLTAGLRYTQDTKRFRPQQPILSTVLPFPPGTLILPDVEAVRKFDKWTPMVNLSYQVTPDFMAYATYSQGFKSGGFTQSVFPPIFPAPGQDAAEVVPSFEPETVEVYEGGFKSDLLDRRLRLNGALFRTSYDNVQITVQNVSVAPIILNAAAARIWGAELEAQAVPVDGLTLEAGLGWLDAKYLETAPGAQVTVDHALLKAPEWSGSAGISYAIKAGPDWEITPRLDYAYRSGTYNDAINSPQAYQPGFSLFNLGVIVENELAGLSFIGRVENIGDKRYVETAFSDDISLGLTELVLNRGRQFSLTVLKKF
jgi:iron complex outermembrane receptor protein